MTSAPRSASLRALGTTAIVAVTVPDALARARALLAWELRRLDLACSRFRPDSELTRVNASAGRTVTVSALLAQAVRVALSAADDTGGLVDPTLGSHMRAAGYDRTFRLVRTRPSWTFREISRDASAWREIELDDDLRALRVPDGVELDLGATAKAWAADRTAISIAAETGAGVLVSLGGDIAVAGDAPAGGWAIRIAEDHGAPLDSPGPVVSIVSGGLATSGTTVRRWNTDRGEVHHVLDPRTARPAPTPWRIISVAAATCVQANVAATAALVLGDGAPDWLAGRRLPARLVGNEGAVSYTGRWPTQAEAA